MQDENSHFNKASQKNQGLREEKAGEDAANELKELLQQPNKPKLSSRLLNSAKFCRFCGAEVEGNNCQGCGQKIELEKDKTNSIFKICFAAAIVLGIGCFVGANVNFHNWFPDNAKAEEYMQKAHTYYESGSPAQALATAQEAINFSPKNGKLRAEYAIVLDQEKHYTEAMANWKKAAALAPEDGKIQEAYAEYFERFGGDAEASLQQFKAIAHEFPKIPNAYLWVGTIDNRLENYDEAHKYFKEYIKLNPKNDNGWLYLAESQKKAGKLKEAIATLQTASKEFPTSSTVHYQLGQYLAVRGDRSGAVVELNKSIDLEPDTADYTSRVISIIDKDKSGRIVIPLKRQGNSYFVDALINNKVHARLIVDSGAETCNLSPSLAQHLGLDMSQALPVAVYSATGAGIGFMTRVDSISVNGANEKKVLVNFHDMPDNFSDGLLGMSFLGRFNFSLDSKHNLLILSKK